MNEPKRSSWTDDWYTSITVRQYKTESFDSKFATPSASGTVLHIATMLCYTEFGCFNCDPSCYCKGASGPGLEVMGLQACRLHAYM